MKVTCFCCSCCRNYSWDCDVVLEDFWWVDLVVWEGSLMVILSRMVICAVDAVVMQTGS